jgi:hypothetical protein
MYCLCKCLNIIFYTFEYLILYLNKTTVSSIIFDFFFTITLTMYIYVLVVFLVVIVRNNL